MPTTSEAIATRMGSPIARSEPKATKSTTAATSSPIISLLLDGGVAFSGTSPPNSTWMPSRSATCAASSSPARASSGATSVTGAP